MYCTICWKYGDIFGGGPSFSPTTAHTVKERTSIPDSANFVGMTASSLPNINPTATAKTKSTSTSIMESLNRVNLSKERCPLSDNLH